MHDAVVKTQNNLSSKPTQFTQLTLTLETVDMEILVLNSQHLS